MKKWMFGLLIAGVALAGCAKQEQENATAEVKAPPQARQLLVEGMVFLKQGDPVKAVDSFARSIKLDPSSSDGYLLLGETFVRVKQYAEATSVLTAATRQFPDNGGAYYLLAVAQQGLGQTSPAAAAARKGAELFEAKGDKGGAQKAALLFAELMTLAKKESEAAMVNNSAKDAEKAMAAGAVSVVAPAPEAAVK
ncbi:MAG: tetratricopeptide repeat protein [Candidatus Omnitrophica bacterium]|nr:tetratricopeptide repeat protein [Candidatus Omnitrophota bacterium]